MKVLLTGGNGFVGSAIGAHLNACGHEITAIVRNSASLGYARTVRAELGTEIAVEKVMDEAPRCDCIVHAAASLAKDVAAPSIALANCLGTQQLVALALRWDRAAIVYISSLPVIGTPQILPITESHPIAPATSYHASKLFGEHVMNAAASEGIPTVSLRLTAPIGPSMPENRILPIFVNRALAGEPIELAGQGTRRQDYVDVRDVAAAVVACVANPQAGGVINIGSGESISNSDLARICIAICGSPSEIRFSGRPDPEEGFNWEVSIERARKTIGYCPGHSLEESIRAIKDAYASRRPQ